MLRTRIAPILALLVAVALPVPAHAQKAAPAAPAATPPATDPLLAGLEPDAAAYVVVTPRAELAFFAWARSLAKSPRLGPLPVGSRRTTQSWGWSMTIS